MPIFYQHCHPTLKYFFTWISPLESKLRSLQSEFGAIPITLFFFIRTSTFCLRLAVLYFFFFSRLKCSYFPDWTLQCHKEECQTAYNKNTLNFISFILFLSSSAHRQPLGGVLQKNSSPTVLKPIKKIPAKEFNFSYKLQASCVQLYESWTPSELFFVDFEHMQLYTL